MLWNGRLEPGMQRQDAGYLLVPHNDGDTVLRSAVAC